MTQNSANISSGTAVSAATSTSSTTALSGKEEHYLKRELISQQVNFEIAELNSPTALQRFGAPFRSPLGEVAPVDSELPILRHIFVHHVRNFPFLDQAKEKEFWQDRLQVFLESFANKRISSSEDRLEETKRRKLALKASKIVELMMNSGIGTTSGYEERVTFNEIEVVDRNADEAGLLMNVPEGNSINGWDINICAVRKTSVKRHVRYHTHAEYLLRSKRAGQEDVIVARKYSDFLELHSTLRGELPGKVLPTIPRKVKDSEEADPEITDPVAKDPETSSLSSSSSSSSSGNSNSIGAMPGAFSNSVNEKHGKKTAVKTAVTTRLYKETQRITLRAFIRSLLTDKQTAGSKALREFLTKDPVQLGQDEQLDERRRKEMDELRIREQREFFEVARQRARDLDIYMEGFRRDIVEDGGLKKLFAEIRKADKLSDLSTRYRKFAEWLRIEVAATIYHIFLAEDNSPELFTQLKRIHSLLPYTAIKHIIRLANPAAVMSSILDLFLATPFGARSLMERVISLSLQDSIKQLQKTLEALEKRIDDPLICAKIKDFVNAPENVKDAIREEATSESIDLVVAIIKSDRLVPEPTNEQIERVFNAYVAWNCAVESVDDSLKAGAQLFVCLKQYLKFVTRERDKAMLQAIVSEPVTLQLFRDLFTIFYDPLIRVYKSANVYNSISDFAVFMDDMIKVIDKCQRQSMSHDPNQTVQAFIDLCARHEDNFYKFVHEVHIHDNGLFDSIMGWLEGILHFLREGPSSGNRLDMNALLDEGVKKGLVDYDTVKKEVDALIAWQLARKRWHEAKTRQKMGGGDDWSATIPDNVFSSADFGVDQADLEDLNELEEEVDFDEEEETDDPIEIERRRRAKKDTLRARSGEPVKPPTATIAKLTPIFLTRLRQVLAN